MTLFSYLKGKKEIKPMVSTIDEKYRNKLRRKYLQNELQYFIQREQSQIQKLNEEYKKKFQQQRNYLQTKTKIIDMKINQDFINNILSLLTSISIRYFHTFNNTLNTFQTGFSRPNKEMLNLTHTESLLSVQDELDGIVTQLKEKINYPNNNFFSNIYKDIIWTDIILKKIDAPWTDNRIFSRRLGPIKRFMNLENDSISNIYVDYILLSYLIESGEMNLFMHDKLGLTAQFKIQAINNKLINVIDSEKSKYHLHSNLFHPEIYHFFSSLLK